MKRSAHTGSVLALAWLCLASPGALAETAVLPPFSTMTSLADGWEPLEFPRIDRHTRYQLITDAGVQVVQATADNSASGLIARVALAPGDSMRLRWQWKVSNVYEQGDARKQSGDDYPARIYVAFEFQPEKAGLFERAKRKTVELMFGETLPGNALNYIWANRLPEQTFIANAFTDQTMMVAVNSGSEQVGQWVTVERDIVADYREAFGEEPPRIVGVAIMSDADNTGERAQAWYRDLVLTAPQAQR